MENFSELQTAGNGLTIAVISDIHANLKNLEKAMEDIEDMAVDEIWCLGDIVGRGYDPAECTEIIRDKCDFVIAGNHDGAINGKLGFFFGSDWIVKTQALALQKISENDLKWFSELDFEGQRHNISCWHGSAHDPIWEFVSDYKLARETLRVQNTSVGLVGHTHQPFYATKQTFFEIEQPVILPLPQEKVLLNPGSVGCPSLFSNLCCWMLLDFKNNNVSWHKI